MTLARIFACYLMRGDVSVVCGQDEHDLINLGIARYRRTNLGVKGAAKNPEACIDEPLVMLAGTLHFDVVLKPGSRGSLQLYRGHRTEGRRISRLIQGDGTKPVSGEERSRCV